MSDEWHDLLAKSETTDVAGAPTHHFDLGEGDPLLLVHGGGLTSAAEMNWGAVIEPLAEHCRVIAPDQPGFGFTPLRDEDDYLPRTRAEFLIEFIEQLDVESVSLAGNSEGGFVTAYIALTRPDLVDKLIIVNSGSASRPITDAEHPGGVGVDGEPSLEDSRAHLEAKRAADFVTTEHHPFLREPITEEKVQRLHEIERRNWRHTNGRDEAVWGTAAGSNRALGYDGRHISYAADRIEVPTLLTWSTMPFVGWPRTQAERGQDETRPKRVTVVPSELEPYRRDEGLELGVRLFERIPESQLALWHDAKHHVMTDQAPEWTRTVASFVTGEP